MRQLRCTQQNPQHGLIYVNLRFLKRFIFMKFSKNNPQQNQIIGTLKQKGAEIEEGNGWFKINIIKDIELVKLGRVEFINKEKTDGEVDDIFFDFFYNKYKEAKFRVDEIK